MVMGCVVQSGLSLVLPKGLAALPALLLLGWGVLDAMLMSFGLKQNTWMQGVIDGKFSAAFPEPGQGSALEGRPGDNGPGAVMILGVRSNSPLGMFAPGR